MIRPLVDDDRPAVLALNQACVPEVGPLDRGGLDALLAQSPWSRVVEVEEGAAGAGVVGLLIGLVEGAGYASPNYRWFSERHDRFAYVDRVALAEPVRGAGHGPALYRAFEAWAVSAGRPVLCAEVNLDPPNERSLRFHHRFGFGQVGEQVAYGRYRVALLEKRLAVDGAPSSSPAEG